MFKLDTSDYRVLCERYKCSEHFFPLISAVLLDQQDGVVYVDNPDDPKQAYVEHSFGFAQVFGQIVATFESDLERYLLIDREFSAPKVRLYANQAPRFLCASKYHGMRAFRQRFKIDAAAFEEKKEVKPISDQELDVGYIDAQNVGEIENIFGVVSRFWRNHADFIHKGKPIVVNYRNQVAGVCYAAAEAYHRVEIDVFTLPEFRGLGVGKFAVIQFVEQCFKHSLQPLWDCFANNAGSVKLSRAVGFSAVDDPYPFYTIDKHVYQGN